MALWKKLAIGGLKIIVILNFSCSPKYQPYKGDQSFETPTGIPNYNKLEYWAAHPDKKDPSDSIPSPLNKNIPTEKSADVFFLHPTIFTDKDETDQLNAKIDDPYINKKTDYTSILYQASVFNETCYIYAPRYRQAHLQMYYISDTIKAKAAFELAYQDIKSAFLVFLETRHKGSPIIIASHSQGTTHAKRLLKEFLDGTDLNKNLAVAYILGIPVEKNYFQNLVPCKDSTETGCFVGWRTYRTGYEKDYISAGDTSITVINPLLWTSDPLKAGKQLHKGAVLYNFNKVYTHTLNSQISGNVLWISKPKFPGSLFYTTKNYHAGDFNLFYVDIREDVKRRIRIHLSKG